jgi:hypothetical protein
VLLLVPDAIAQFAFNLSATSALIRLPAAILIDALVLVIVVVLVRSERNSRPATGLIVKAQGAIADVSIESARERILRAVRAVPDVLSAETDIKAVRGKADVDLEVAVSRESVNLPEKQREIDRALRQVVSKQLGLQLAGKPRVHLRMSDEAPAIPEPPPSLPSLVPEPVKLETPAAVPEPTPAPFRFESLDTMSVRQEADATDNAEPPKLSE